MPRLLGAACIPSGRKAPPTVRSCMSRHRGNLGGVWRELVRDWTLQSSTTVSGPIKGLIAMRQALQSSLRRLQVFRSRTTVGTE